MSYRGDRSGFLTGRYARANMPADGRVPLAGEDLEESTAGRAVERNFRIVDAATVVAARRGRPIPASGTCLVVGCPWITAPTIWPRTFNQLEVLLDATDLELSEEDRRVLEEPAPPPETSPHRMLRGQIGQPDVPSVRRPGRV